MSSLKDLHQHQVKQTNKRRSAEFEKVNTEHSLALQPQQELELSSWNSFRKPCTRPSTWAASRRPRRRLQPAPLRPQPPPRRRPTAGTRHCRRIRRRTTRSTPIWWFTTAAWPVIITPTRRRRRRRRRWPPASAPTPRRVRLTPPDRWVLILNSWFFFLNPRASGCLAKGYNHRLKIFGSRKKTPEIVWRCLRCHKIPKYLWRIWVVPLLNQCIRNST